MLASRANRGSASDSGRAVRPRILSWDDRLMPLNHVALTVSDRAVSAAFYSQHFGLTDGCTKTSTS